MGLLSFLGLSNSEPVDAAASETETVRRIVGALDEMEPDRAKLIAASAYILSRVAGADMDVSDDETERMERIVAEQLGLPEAQAVLAVQIAKSQAQLFGGTENFVVTREYNRLASREQKLALLDCLFRVAAADDDISTLEDNEVRRISNELKLSHTDFIAARVRYREHLSVLKHGSKSS